MLEGKFLAVIVKFVSSVGMLVDKDEECRFIIDKLVFKKKVVGGKIKHSLPK